MYGKNGAQAKVDNKYKDRSNENGVRRNIPPSNGNTTKLQPVLNVKSEDKRNNKSSSQQKIGSRFPDIHHSKAKTGKSRDPVKLPAINLRSGNNSNLSKVKHNVRKVIVS